MKVPVDTLVPLPDALSFETGAAISCGTGTAYGALKRVALQGGETIAIFGQGPVGLSATQLAVAMGARVIALDVGPERRKLAKEFGAHEVINARSNNPVEAIRELTHGEGAHKTLDTSGAAEARAAAVRATRSWGTACFVGERGQVTLDVSPDMLRRQMTLVGLVDLLAAGPGGLRRVRRRPQDRRREAVHRPLAARPGRGGLPPVRHPDHRQGRDPAVVKHRAKHDQHCSHHRRSIGHRAGHRPAPARRRLDGGGARHGQGRARGRARGFRRLTAIACMCSLAMSRRSRA